MIISLILSFTLGIAYWFLAVVAAGAAVAAIQHIGTAVSKLRKWLHS